MATLQIIKSVNDYFRFVLDGDMVNSIIDNAPNTTSFGSIFHFKTKNGAVLFGKQNITFADVTYTDITATDFTFASVDALWIKLISEGFFDGLGSGGGGGVNRFDDLLDTFDYFGNNGKVPVVNSSLLKLEPSVFYNFKDFIQLEDVDIPTLIAGKIVSVALVGGIPKVVLTDPPPVPVQLANAIGYFNIQDLQTNTTPLNYTSGQMIIVNDSLGDDTDISQRPFGVTNCWNNLTNRFDFTDLTIGDMLTVSVNLLLSTLSANQFTRLTLTLGIGTPSEKAIDVATNFFESTQSFLPYSAEVSFFIGNEDVRTAPAKIEFSSDSIATIKVDAFYINVVRKGVNTMTFTVDADDAISADAGNTLVLGTDNLLFVPETPLGSKENSANKQNSLAYDGLGIKFPTVDAVNNLTRVIGEISARTGLIHKSDNFDMIPLNVSTARIQAVTSVIFVNKLQDPLLAPSESIKSFPQKDYVLTQLVTATGGNVNLNPLTTDGLYVRWLGYDFNGNVYSSLNDFKANDDIFQIGFVTVLKSGGSVTFLDGIVAGGRNTYASPAMACNTDFDKVAENTTTVTVAYNTGSASLNRLAGTVTGISINWKGTANVGNSNPIDIFNVPALNTVPFVSVNPTFLTSVVAPTIHTLWTELEGGIAVNNRFWNTATSLPATLNNNVFSIKRVLVGIRGGIFLQDGEHASPAGYSTMNDAKSAIDQQAFTTAIIPNGVVIEVARIAFKKSVTNFNDPAEFFLKITGSGSGSSGSTPISDVVTAVTNITASVLSGGQNVDGFVAYINGLPSFSLAINEIREWLVTDTKQVFKLLLRGRAFGTGQPAITSANVLEVNPPDTVQLIITTAVAINPNTLSNGVNQKGRNVIIDNSVPINYDCTSYDGFVASFEKVTGNAITFVAGAGRTLVQVDGTAVLNGIAGSTAVLSSVGTKDYLRISNA